MPIPSPGAPKFSVSAVEREELRIPPRKPERESCVIIIKKHFVVRDFVATDAGTRSGCG